MMTPTPECPDNNVNQPWEVCDGSDLDGETCASIGMGFSSGILRCKSDCTGWNVSQCENGCADKTREAFASTNTYPEIAGCAGSFTNKDLRATGPDTASSLCADGWHICMRDGYPSELEDKLTAGQCYSASGRYVAASSHADIGTSPNCYYNYPLPCAETHWGSEPICCGSGCSDSNLCEDAVWTGDTETAPGHHEGCADANIDAITGALCCKD